MQNSSVYWLAISNHSVAAKMTALAQTIGVSPSELMWLLATKRVEPEATDVTNHPIPSAPPTSAEPPHRFASLRKMVGDFLANLKRFLANLMRGKTPASEPSEDWGWDFSALPFGTEMPDWETYFRPQSLTDLREQFLTTAGIELRLPWYFYHDFTHLFQGVEKSKVVNFSDVAGHLIRQLNVENLDDEKIKATAVSWYGGGRLYTDEEARHAASYLIEQVKIFADLNQMTVQEFVQAVQDQQRQGELLGQRPTAVPIFARPK